MASRDNEHPPEFFVDRSLGKSIVEGLRAAGLTVHLMAEVYGEKQAQHQAVQEAMKTQAPLMGAEVTVKGGHWERVAADERGDRQNA